MNIYVNPGASMIMTPAHNYAGTTDFADILDDMKHGNFPTGTGQPFPVNFDEPSSEVDSASPWVNNRSTQFADPPANEIMGPKHFGL